MVRLINFVFSEVSNDQSEFSPPKVAGPVGASAQFAEADFAGADFAGALLPQRSQADLYQVPSRYMDADFAGAPLQSRGRSVPVRNREDLPRRSGFASKRSSTSEESLFSKSQRMKFSRRPVSSLGLPDGRNT